MNIILVSDCIVGYDEILVDAKLRRWSSSSVTLRQWVTRRLL
jgi:hypothetical protein